MVGLLVPAIVETYRMKSLQINKKKFRIMNHHQIQDL
jgi:hypothetical protein